MTIRLSTAGLSLASAHRTNSAHRALAPCWPLRGGCGSINKLLLWTHFGRRKGDDDVLGVGGYRLRSAMPPVGTLTSHGVSSMAPASSATICTDDTALRYR
jgi:hypothetical protein